MVRIKVGDEFADEEYDHILQCEDCLQVFILCLKSDTFAAVLKQLGYGDEIEQFRIA